MSPVVEKAKFSDMKYLVELLRQLFIIEEDFDFDERRQKKGLAMMLGPSEAKCVMVVREGNIAVGMCTAQLVVSTSEGGWAGLVEDMVVDEKHRGKGLGGLLLQAVEAWCVEKGAMRIQLLADADNGKGREFYRKQSWRGTNLVCLRKKFNE